MRHYSIKTVSLSIITLMLLLSVSSTAIASYKQWPLRNKGVVKYMRMIKVYDISLYSPSLITANNVLNPNVSKCLKLDYAVNLTVDKFRLATDKVLKRQHDQAYLNSIKEPLASLQNAYKPVKKGDSYHLCYNGKNKVMRLDLNDKTLIEIKSIELAKAYLGIWLSDNKPISMPLYNDFFANK